MPNLAGLELFCLPAEIRLLGLAALEGPVSEKLRIPFAKTKLPRHAGTAEFALPFVPPTVHRPVPGKGRPVFAREHGFYAFGRPVLEPIGKLLNRSEVGVKIDRVHRAQIPRSVVINNA